MEPPFPALAGGFFMTEPPGKPHTYIYTYMYVCIYNEWVHTRFFSCHEMCLYTQTYIHAYMYMHIHVCMYIYDEWVHTGFFSCHEMCLFQILVPHD